MNLSSKVKMRKHLYPLPFKMHVSEYLNNYNSRRFDEIMVTQENKLLHSLISYIYEPTPFARYLIIV